MVCALAGVGVAVAQERGHGECEHHGRGHGHAGGHMLKKMDANNDGSISRAEFNTATQAHFTRMDQNNDGVITAAELQSAREAHRGHREGRGQHQGRPQGGAGTGG
jgi:hypothetical protein